MWSLSGGVSPSSAPGRAAVACGRGRGYVDGGPTTPPWSCPPVDLDVRPAPRAGGLTGAAQGPADREAPGPHVLSQQWIERVVGWLGKVFLQDGPARPASPEAGPTLRRWRCHAQRFFYRTYAGLRIEELFSIIRGRPPRHP